MLGSRLGSWRQGGTRKAGVVVCGDLCGFYAVAHSHAHVSAWRYVVDVAFLGCCTWSRALNQTLMAWCIVVWAGSCGSLGFSTS